MLDGASCFSLSGQSISGDTSTKGAVPSSNALVVPLHHLIFDLPSREFERPPVGGPDEFVKISIETPGYAAKIVLYFFFGAVDAMWQITAYWLMGAMSNDPGKLAHFAGLCESSSRSGQAGPWEVNVDCCHLIDKSIQSAGAAGIWRADGVRTP